MKTKSKNDMIGTDATRLSRGVSRSRLQKAAISSRMPRACRVESHVRFFSSQERETPRDKRVASAELQQRPVGEEREAPRDKRVASESGVPISLCFDLVTNGKLFSAHQKDHYLESYRQNASQHLASLSKESLMS